ncbi:conserved hypothetical protein [Mesorhizobium ventifaucium]|uniref:Uncharacterized protein n=1 Tax=Mesorhizobium ventifaucium TaxID=666020 RepID=A0ABM9E5W9_9HYPH|nr:conserved hypothetical protein [Mesorhizobium ventifaucium]
MGEESIMRPPAAKKAAITSAHSSRSTGSSPTLKVIQVPSPTAGSISPEEGTARITGAGGAPGAAADNTRAAPEAAAAFTNVLRVMIIVCHLCTSDPLYFRSPILPTPRMVPADRLFARPIGGECGRSLATVRNIKRLPEMGTNGAGLGCAKQSDYLEMAPVLT